MAVYVVNMVVYAHVDFEQTFILANDSDESLLNLTGYSVSAKMKRYGSSSNATKNFTAAITNASAGQVKLSLGDDETASLSPGKYYYDILLTNPSGNKTRVVEGEVLVKKAVTR
mgnify:CR=1 FL=1